VQPCGQSAISPGPHCNLNLRRAPFGRAQQQNLIEEATVFGLETTFGVPPGHTLRLVRTVRRGSDGEVWEQEHEEYDTAGRLVAVYESWPGGAPSLAGREGGGDGRGGYVKYSPDGRLLRRFYAAPRMVNKTVDRAATWARL
jgi:hypothetical protein